MKWDALLYKPTTDLRIRKIIPHLLQKIKRKINIFSEKHLFPNILSKPV